MCVAMGWTANGMMLGNIVTCAMVAAAYMVFAPITWPADGCHVLLRSLTERHNEVWMLPSHPHVEDVRQEVQAS